MRPRGEWQSIWAIRVMAGRVVKPAPARRHGCPLMPCVSSTRGRHPRRHWCAAHARRGDPPAHTHHHHQHHNTPPPTLQTVQMGPMPQTLQTLLPRWAPRGGGVFAPRYARPQRLTGGRGRNSWAAAGCASRACGGEYYWHRGQAVAALMEPAQAACIPSPACPGSFRDGRRRITAARLPRHQMCREGDRQRSARIPKTRRSCTSS